MVLEWLPHPGLSGPAGSNDSTSAVSDGAALPVAAGEERGEMFPRRRDGTSGQPRRHRGSGGTPRGDGGGGAPAMAPPLGAPPPPWSRRGSDAEPWLAGGGVRLGAWGQQVLSARGLKRVGSRSEHAM